MRRSLSLHAKKVPEVSVLILDPAVNDVTIRNTLAKDNIRSRKDAINMIYRVLRAPGNYRGRSGGEVTWTISSSSRFESMI